MPSYEYEIPGAGVRFTLLRPVARRDEPVAIDAAGVVAETGEALALPEGLAPNPPVRRIPVPQSIGVPGTARDPWDADNQMADAWKHLEDRGQLQPWMMRPAEARAALAAPDAEEPPEALVADQEGALDAALARGDERVLPPEGSAP